MRVIDGGAIDHLVSASLRYRRAEVDLAKSVSIANGAFNLREEPIVCTPADALRIEESLGVSTG